MLTGHGVQRKAFKRNSHAAGGGGGGYLWCRRQRYGDECEDLKMVSPSSRKQTRTHTHTQTHAYIVLTLRCTSSTCPHAFLAETRDEPSDVMSAAQVHAHAHACVYVYVYASDLLTQTERPSASRWADVLVCIPGF